MTFFGNSAELEEAINTNPKGLGSQGQVRETRLVRLIHMRGVSLLLTTFFFTSVSPFFLFPRWRARLVNCCGGCGSKETAPSRLWPFEDWWPAAMSASVELSSTMRKYEQGAGGPLS